MKILLDECLPKRLKNHLSDFDVFTVVELGLSGIKNGKLISYCVENGFDIFLTIDKNLIYQQDVKKYPIVICVFDSPTSRIDELVTFIPSFLNQIEMFEKYKSYSISKEFPTLSDRLPV